MEQNDSFFAQFYKEREGIETLHSPHGFATYKVSPDYIQLIDVYIAPEYRQQGLASKFADQVASIGKEFGKSAMITTVDLQTIGATDSTIAILLYGFKLDSSDSRLLYFIKEI